MYACLDLNMSCKSSSLQGSGPMFPAWTFEDSYYLKCCYCYCYCYHYCCYYYCYYVYYVYYMCYCYCYCYSNFWRLAVSWRVHLALCSSSRWHSACSFLINVWYPKNTTLKHIALNHLSTNKTHNVMYDTLCLAVSMHVLSGRVWFPAKQLLGKLSCLSTLKCVFTRCLKIITT